MSDRAGETAAIFTTHGVLDAMTTVAAARAAGVDAEANPIVRELLTVGEGPAVLAMLVAVAACCIVWPTAADALDAPEWLGFAVALVGSLVAAVNIVVVLA
ncbi:hypothetical protein GRS48_00410 [Halorubrum sp. JWXQ-INN 858]|uniref:hypothetical protein n=1 Tax=Halorubrum sp. JWXQ-INN 858 TaxID=2690782 RepID=UPI001359198A|nr:hypothetical protein [Halorubrum sp. JWXQ-INN 858]MWV63296.1 hypothetical protein [Halorubrum sp. JWXQ-INN 858]